MIAECARQLNISQGILEYILSALATIMNDSSFVAQLLAINAKINTLAEDNWNEQKPLQPVERRHITSCYFFCPLSSYVLSLLLILVAYSFFPLFVVKLCYDACISTYIQHESCSLANSSLFNYLETYTRDDEINRLIQIKYSYLN